MFEKILKKREKKGKMPRKGVTKRMDFSLMDSESLGQFDSRKAKATIFLKPYKEYKFSEDLTIKTIVSAIVHESLHQAIHHVLTLDGFDTDSIFYILTQNWVEELEERSKNFHELSLELFEKGYISKKEVEYRLFKYNKSETIELF